MSKLNVHRLSTVQTTLILYTHYDNAILTELIIFVITIVNITFIQFSCCWHQRRLIQRAHWARAQGPPQEGPKLWVEIC